MRAQVAAIHAHETGARRARDPEEVHQVRVAVRRLRAILRASRPLFVEEWVAGLRRELDWLGSALGRLRDLDVLRAHLRSQLGRGAAGGRAARERLLGRLAADRERATAALRAVLAGRRHARLLARLDAAVGDPPLRADDDVSLPDIAAAEFDKLRRAVKRLPKHPSAEELHAIRIKVKRARYAAELAQPLLGRRNERFIERARKVQDILGEHQDAITAERYIRRAIGSGPAARRLARQLIGREAERRDAAREAFAEQWPKLKRRGRRALG
ncbi:MAG TPA: CHAD domain-containing protein [Methylomirabilota bacterium]|nr:CHAD domain-containing protein [Methylomirabilota bacterium]